MMLLCGWSVFNTKKIKGCLPNIGRTTLNILLHRVLLFVMLFYDLFDFGNYEVATTDEDGVGGEC